MLDGLLNLIVTLPILVGETSFLTTAWTYIWVGFQVALGIGFVIFVHELGHFLAAKTFGVKCEKFYIGFDFPISIGPIKLPRSLGKFQWGETEYGIGILPLGGYVKMLGQDDDPRNAAEEAERSRMGDGPDAPLDPRSYEAKKVWQRMIIISAGVIMNLIFAVIIAAFAFWLGVPYRPAIVGEAIAGGPAWIEGIKPGDEIKQVARMKADQKHFRYDDLRTMVMIEGMRTSGGPIRLEWLHAEERKTEQVPPTNQFTGDKNFFSLGLRESLTSKLDSTHPVGKYSYLASQKVDLQPDDEIIAVDGEALTRDPRFGKILADEVLTRWQSKWEQPVELTVLRTAGDAKSTAKPEDAPKQEVKVRIPATPMKQLGIGFKLGAITAVQKRSPAEKAGVKVGDQIETVDGAPVGDAMRLPAQVARKQGKPVELVLSRGGTTQAEKMSVSLTSDVPVRFAALAPAGAYLELPGLGIAVEALPIVSFVDSDATKATEQIAIGDELIEFTLEPTPEQRKSLEEEGHTIESKPQKFDRWYNVPVFAMGLQNLPEGLPLRCTFKRNGETREVVLPLAYSKDWFSYQRGVALSMLEEIQQTNDLSQASVWGVDETLRKLDDVIQSLKLMVTGRASRKGVAGPLGIFEVAASQAKESPSLLLLFLTFLSANLAILNLLPIPALDGGHLMFLTAEAVMGRKLNETMQMRLTMVGVLFLLGLMAFAVVNDLFRIFG